MPTTYGAKTKHYPGREQNLFIGQMKHLHVLKDGLIKYQKKELDARISGKNLITRFLIFDLDSMMAYGECHSDETKHDLSGFLARAWSVKPDHPMHGIPTVLNVPQVVFKNEGYRADMEVVTRASRITLGTLPSGFSEGVHAIKQFDEHVRALSYREITLEFAQNCSAAISNRIRSWWGGDNVDERWASVPLAPDAFFEAIDRMYVRPGGWRRGPFEPVMIGLEEAMKLMRNGRSA